MTNPFKTPTQRWFDRNDVGAWIMGLGFGGLVVAGFCLVLSCEEQERAECERRHCTPPSVPRYISPYKSASYCICAEVPR